MTQPYHVIYVFFIVLLAIGCGSKKEVTSENTLSQPVQTDTTDESGFMDTANYVRFYRNDTLIDESNRKWDMEEVNEMFAASVVTDKFRTFQITEIPRSQLLGGDEVMLDGYVLYVDPTSLPVKVELKKGEIRYNYRMFGGQNRIWIQGELTHTSPQATKVFEFNLYGNYPESEQIDALDEQFIDEE